MACPERFFRDSHFAGSINHAAARKNASSKSALLFSNFRPLRRLENASMMLPKRLPKNMTRINDMMSRAVLWPWNASSRSLDFVSDSFTDGRR